ncbi:uncharacterized protein LOC131221404 [Magnolia sinica]|uniref:uncharacterized protein LOC131221404 n=1 Tax=Magnolia sinica TaxID=86752 RepID=UPI002657D887|nr:uncharacterized protein LOC131221404 [Magnolia sinica]
MGIPTIPRTLNSASVIDIMKTTFGDAIVVLSSGKAVADVQPQFDELRNCDANEVIMTGLAEMELWSCIQERSIASQVKHTEIEWLFISLRTTGKGDNRSTHFGIDQEGELRQVVFSMREAWNRSRTWLLHEVGKKSRMGNLRPEY